jgi:hypothetical protein
VVEEPLPQSEPESEPPAPTDTQSEAPEPEVKGPRATRFSDKGNTIAGIDGTNKTWEGGFDLKPGKYRTVDNFDPQYDPNPGLTCAAWSSAPDSDDLEGQREFDDKWHAILKIRDGDLVTSVGCGTWKRVS